MMNTELIIKNRVHQLYWENDDNCATTSIIILSELFQLPVHDHVLHASLTMHGAGGLGAQCGLIEGPLMFIGIIGKQRGLSNKEISALAKAFAELFKHKFESFLCSELRPQPSPTGPKKHLCENLSCKTIIASHAFLQDLLKTPIKKSTQPF